MDNFVASSSIPSTEKNSVSLIASIEINKFVKKDGKSLRQIAHYSDVAYSYIRRLANQEIADDKIEPVKLFQVLKFIRKPAYAYSVIEVNSAWAKKVRAWTGFSKELIQKSTEKKDIESIILKDDQTILAFLLAINSSKTNYNQLRDVGGTPLVKAANYLIEQGILICTNNIIKNNNLLSDHMTFSFSRNACQKILAVVIKYYDVAHSGELRNYIAVGTQSVSIEFIRDFLKQIEKLRKWYNENIVKESSIGDIPFFYTVVMDTFVDEIVKTKEVIQ